MKKIQLLNIPNFYSSYYLLGLTQEFKVKFKMDANLIKFNNKPIIIFKLKNKIVVIDNDDPSGVNQELYELANIYFVTNKLKDNDSYKQHKIRPLYPHYPVNIAPLYLWTFRLSLFRYINLKEVARQIYILSKRPLYKQDKPIFKKDNFIFFSSNIWKKEPQTNEIRAEFIRFCKADTRIEFEGGLIPRSDGNNYGFDSEINTVKYSPKVFSKLSAKSKIALNNPAVCGAVSWRLAEYLNQGLFVLSFPFKIDLPKDFVHELNMYYINSPDEYGNVLNTILIHPELHEKISRNGKAYFDRYCTPRAQVKYMMQALSEI